MIAILTGIVATGPVSAQNRPAADENLAAFDIPEQSLVSALEHYTLTTGVQIFYASTLAAGRRSSAVSGRYSPQEALLIVLEGTGLRPRLTATDAVTLELIRSTAPLESPAVIVETGRPGAVLRMDPLMVDGALDAPALRRYAFYAVSVRSAVSEALRRDSGLRERRYRIRLSVWLDQSGKIERAAVHRSSGTATIDDAVVRTIARVTIEPRPPVGLPQPIHIDIVATGS